MRSQFLNKKNIFFKLIFIIFFILYVCEFILSFKTHNFNYLVNIIFNKNLISSKMITNYVLSENGFLTLGNNKEYKIYCDYQKNILIKTDKYGLVNLNKKWDDKNKILLLQTKGNLNCDNFNLIQGNIKIKTNKIINFGNFSVGPAHQYALIKEHFKNSIFDKVIWMHFEGSDLSEINNTNNKNLLNYLNDNNYTSNLSSKNNNFDKFIKVYNYKILKRTLKNFIFFYYTKSYINKKKTIKSNFEIKEKKIKFNEIDEFINILIKTQEFLNKNFTDFYFIYMPTIDDDYASIKNKLIKKSLKKKLIKNKIKFIDLKEFVINNNDQLIIIDKFIN